MQTNRFFKLRFERAKTCQAVPRGKIGVFVGTSAVVQAQAVSFHFVVLSRTVSYTCTYHGTMVTLSQNDLKYKHSASYAALS